MLVSWRAQPWQRGQVQRLWAGGQEQMEGGRGDRPHSAGL